MRRSMAGFPSTREKDLRARGPLGADPIAVESEGHAPRKLRRCHWACGHVGRVDYNEVASVVLGAVDHGHEPAVALGRSRSSRYEHRFARCIAVRKLKMGARACLVIEMGNRVEGYPLPLTGVRSEVTVTIGKSGAAFIEPRKFAGKIVNIFALDGVALALDVEGPERQARV